MNLHDGSILQSAQKKKGLLGPISLTIQRTIETTLKIKISSIISSDSASVSQPAVVFLNHDLLMSIILLGD